MIGTVCCQFQLLRKHFDLDSGYSLIECYKQSSDKIIIYLNFDDDKDNDIKVEREKFEDIVDDLLKYSGWYLVPSFLEYKIKANGSNLAMFSRLFWKGKTNIFVFSVFNIISS